MNITTLNLAAAPAVSVSIEAVADEPESALEPVVALYDGEGVEIVSVEDYVVGCVMHEMPYTFDLQAREAQAVAARSYLYYCLENGSFSHPMGDVCTDVTHCMGYITKEAYASKYGASNAELAYAAAYEAAYLTRGEVALYGGKPALTVWHSSSDGFTESAEDLWGGSLPYLVSVETPENASVTEVRVSLARARELLNAAGYEISRERAVYTERNPSGRCGVLHIFGTAVDGGDARFIFSLRSADFDVVLSGGELVFTVRGYGHGVGISQYGADAMARMGADHAEILLHYYKGCTLGVYR